MLFRLTPAAADYVRGQGSVLTITSLMMSSCCGTPMPPEVTLGAPRDPEGFYCFSQDDLTIWFDSLLEPRPAVEIDLKDYGRRRELLIQQWESRPRG